MCKERKDCEFRSDPKGCALKHISEARKMISSGKIEDADVELMNTEKCLQEE